MTLAAGGSDTVHFGSFRNALPPILLLTALFFLNFISRVLFSPLLSEIEADLGLHHAAVGSFFLLISSGYFISILLSGLVSSRLGNKATIIFSTLGCGALLVIIGQSMSLWGIRIGLFFLGYMAGLYLQSGLATILQLVAPTHLARGMAVHELAPNCAFVAAPLLSTFMLHYIGWRHGLQLWGLIMIGGAIVYGFRGPAGTKSTGAVEFGLFLCILRLPEFWCVVLLFSFAICSTLGVYTMLPLFLVTEHDMEVQYANTLVAFSRISAVFMPLAGGWLGDRFGNGKVMVASLLIAGVLTLPLGFLSGYPLLFSIVMQPIVAVCFFPSGFAVLSRIGGKQAGGNAVSLCIPFAFLLGGGVVPMVVGIIGDYFSLADGFLVAAVLMIVAAGLGGGNRMILFD